MLKKISLFKENQDICYKELKNKIKEKLKNLLENY